MNTSFYTGINGSKTDQFAMDVISDNISNINTVGFKGSTAEFSTIFSSTMADAYTESSLNDLGLGSRPGATALNMEQGIFQTTDSTFDFAIGGEGWFGVQGNSSDSMYTRAGIFSVDANGDLVDPSGNYLLGTSGNNITPTTLSQEVLDEIGTYYRKDTQELGTPYIISELDDITLIEPTAQTKINLPDILYYPPVPTATVSYKANLDPSINISSTHIAINDNDIDETIDAANQTISINGSISSSTDILDPKEKDTILVTTTDITGKKVETSTTLDENLNWQIFNEDISSLDTDNDIITTAEIITTQEVPNVEHFSSTIISPEGKKDILDMTYTKRIPQSDTGSVWDGVMQVHTFFGDYDPAVTYDPSLYKVDVAARKVYEIVDSQPAIVSFDGEGKLINSEISTMNNSGASMIVDVGEPDSFSGFISSSNIEMGRSEEHDGTLSGMLTQYGMDANGNIVAEFDNGEVVPVSKVAIYHFQNDQGLEKISSTLLSESTNSGKPIFYTDVNGDFMLGSQIFSQRLESSNVDLSVALTELIAIQRTFDASAKIITTSDQLIQNAINMKR